MLVGPFEFPNYLAVLFSQILFVQNKSVEVFNALLPYVAPFEKYCQGDASQQVQRKLKISTVFDQGSKQRGCMALKVFDPRRIIYLDLFSSKHFNIHLFYTFQCLPVCSVTDELYAIEAKEKVVYCNSHVNVYGYYISFFYGSDSNYLTSSLFCTYFHYNCTQLCQTF